MLQEPSVQAIVPRGNLTSLINTGKGAATTSNQSGIYPKFIRPQTNPKAGCNIWGPLCQTGSIVVGVTLSTTVSTTTVPCSEYLSAQAESAQPGYLAGRGQGYEYVNPLDKDYQASFGRSPECKSYVEHSVVKRQHSPFDPLDPGSTATYGESSNLTFSNCGSNQVKRPEYYTPPGVSRSSARFGGPFLDYFCCGVCTLMIDEIRLLYFPPPTTGDCSGNHGPATLSSAARQSSDTIRPRVASITTNGSVLVSDGYT